MNKLLLIILLFPLIGFGQDEYLEFWYDSEKDVGSVMGKSTLPVNIYKQFDSRKNWSGRYNFLIKDIFGNIPTTLTLFLNNGEKVSLKYFSKNKWNETNAKYDKVSNLSKYYYAYNIEDADLEKLRKSKIVSVGKKDNEKITKADLDGLNAVIGLILSYQYNTHVGRIQLELKDVRNSKGFTGSRKSSELSYVDSLMSIKWDNNKTQLGFELHNKSEKTIKIVWDDAAYIGVDGKSSRVFHKGIKYTNREESQPPSSIYSISTLSDLVAPTDYSYYSSASTYSSGWKSKPLFKYELKGIYAKTEEENVIDIKQTSRVVLPIRVEDEVVEYSFVFELSYK